MRIKWEVTCKPLGLGLPRDPRRGMRGTDPKASHPGVVQAAVILTNGPPGGPLTSKFCPCWVRSLMEDSSDVVW